MSELMLLGVLRAPIPKKDDELSIVQLALRAREAADEIERLNAEVERLRRDAERYRWLRNLDNAMGWLGTIPSERFIDAALREGEK